MIPGAVVQVAPLSLFWRGFRRCRHDFFTIVLSFPIVGMDGRLLAAVQLTTISSRS